MNSVGRGSPYRVSVSDGQPLSDMGSEQHRDEKIVGAICCAALAVGGKQLWDRRHGGEHPPRSGNALSTAAISAAGAFAGYEAGELYANHTRKSKTGGMVGPNVAYQKRGGRSRSLPSTRTRREAVGGAAEIQHAAKAALLAGATEAFRVRKEHGGWDGPKGKRVLTAALGAGVIDAAAEHKSPKHPKRHALEAIVGGLAGNRMVNGPRNNIEQEWRRKPRSSYRELSDSESSISESYDSRSPSPSPGIRYENRKRGKNVKNYTRKGLAAIGVK